MGVCVAPGCERSAVARDLCMLHYKRVRAGRPLTDPRMGSPDGCGRYGILDTDGERCLCHECGRWYRSLGAHVVAAHGRIIPARAGFTLHHLDGRPRARDHPRSRGVYVNEV